MLVERDPLVVLRVWVLASFVKVDARNDTHSSLDEPVSQTACAAEQIHACGVLSGPFGLSVHRPRHMRPFRNFSSDQILFWPTIQSFHVAWAAGKTTLSKVRWQV